jgi:hypothetical protein
MAKIAWSFRIQPDPNREYIVAATTGLGVSWRDFRKIFSFQVYTRRIIDQLNGSPDCVGFALHGTLKPLEGSTLSVWENAEALRRFQKENAHGEAVDVLGSNETGRFQYIQWKSRCALLPQTWEELGSRFKPKE